MEITHPDFTVYNFGKRIGKGHRACLDGFDFRAFKLNAAFVRFFDEVVEVSLFVLRDNLYTFGHTLLLY